MYTLLEKKESVSSPQKVVFTDLMDPRKYSAFFDNTFLSTAENEPVPEHFQFVATISEFREFSYIHGKINSAKEDKSFQELDFEWCLTELSNTKTEISYKIYDIGESKAPIPVTKSHHTVTITAFVAAAAIGFASVPLAYAAAQTVGSATILAPMASKAIAVSGTAAKSTSVSKTILAAITMSIVATGSGGIILGDAYFSDPVVEYSLYPAQLPADLHGTSLTVSNVYSTDEKSEILHYDCDAKSIIHGQDYTFDCLTENSLGHKQLITTTVSVKEPRDSLSAKATQCVSQHYMLPDDVTSDYPYLSNLPNISSGSLSNYKNTHIRLMDDSFENRDYVSAKEHATIVLRYFNINDVQALSTLGNVMRDEDRGNISGTQCAIAIHSTPFLSNTAWGKLSLAEDYHVLWDFEKAADLASLVIDDYPENPDIHETTYKNALIIKANALFRTAMAEKSDNVENVRKYYTMAHEIQPSYDSWFGLGNLDRYVGNFDDALVKYEQAKKLATDTTEIDHEMSVLLSYI